MKNLHLVYPSDVILSLKKALENEGFFISGMDYTLEQFKEAAAAGQVDTKSIIIIEGTAGIGRKSDIYTNLREIRSFLPTTRLIVQLASDMKKDIKLITPIVHLAIYDIHFVTEFGIEELKEWIHFEKTIADYSQIIGSEISKDNSQIQQTNSTYVENKSTPTKGGGFFSKIFGKNPGVSKPGEELDKNLSHDNESRSSDSGVTETGAAASSDHKQVEQNAPQTKHHEAAFANLEETDLHLTLTTKKNDSQGINAYQRALEEDNFNEAFTLKAAAPSASDTKPQEEGKNQLQAAEQAELERQKAELESKQVELERQKTEQIAKQAELERQKAEQETKQAELERQKAEQAKQVELERQEVEKAKQAELERQKEELDAKQAELERQKAEQEAKQAELERQRAEQEKQAELQRQESEQAKQAELERQKAELDAQQAELERQRAEQIANQAELERQQAEKAQQAELERQHAELEAKQAELERQIAEQEAMQADLERQKAEQEAKQAKLERQQTHQAQLERQESKQAKQAELERSKIAAARKREQDSNIYDIMDDDVELTKRTVVFKERIVGTVKLGVAGAERRTGTTYQALQTSYYLASLGFKVACVENLDENRSSTFATFRTDVPAQMSKGFTYKKVDFYPQSTIEDYVRIVGSQYDYVVADFGDVRDEKTQLEFMRCDVQIMTIGAAVWDFKDFSNVWKKFSHWEFRKVWHVLVNFADDEMYKEMTGAFSKKDQASLKMSFIKNPYVPNPLQLTTDQSAIERMVRSVIPKQDLKKKWFGRS